MQLPQELVIRILEGQGPPILSRLEQDDLGPHFHANDSHNSDPPRAGCDFVNHFHHEMQLWEVETPFTMFPNVQKHKVLEYSPECTEAQ
jgi:hypothetical protein